MNVLKTTLFTVLLLPGTVTVVVPYMILSSETGGATRGTQMTIIVGVAAIAVGAYIYLPAALAFALQGRGTPAPVDPPRVLVATGVYRYVRNPMYLAVLIVLLGEAVVFSSPRLVVYTAAVAAVFHLFVVLYEEPRLRRSFGEEYALNTQRVPRWVPKPPEKTAEREGTGDRPTGNGDTHKSS